MKANGHQHGDAGEPLLDASSGVVLIDQEDGLSALHDRLFLDANLVALILKDLGQAVIM